MKKLSIVTITLNDAETIEQTVKSILSQNYPNLEYIVIDGGSTDSTLSILNKYKDKFKYFKSSPDKGIYDAFNKGMQLAKGDYIGFLNSDDFYANNDVFSIEYFKGKIYVGTSEGLNVLDEGTSTFKQYDYAGSSEYAVNVLMST